MAHVDIVLNDARSFLSEQPEKLQEKVNQIHEMIHNKTGLGNDF